MNKKIHEYFEISINQQKSIADIIKDAGVGIFSGVTVGIVFDPKLSLFAPLLAVGMSFFLWYISLKITNLKK